MAQSFQHEKPPARINLFLEVKTDGAERKIELPLRLLMVGDYTGREDGTPLEDREIIEINKSDKDIDTVMKSMDLRLDYTVPNRLAGEGEMKVNLKIDDLKSFHPEQVARRVPELKQMLTMRNLLQDLRNRVVGMKEFRKQLEQVVQDKEALDKLVGELDKFVIKQEADEAT